MATKEFPLIPEDVEKIDTKHRTICTPIPAPKSVDLLKELRRLEPRSMGGQPTVVWDRGEGAYVFDAYGNKWGIAVRG